MLAGRANRQTTGLPILEQNRHAVLVFLRMQTQWDRAGMAGERCGLNYGRLSYVIAQMGLSDREPVLFGQLQIMEIAALKEFSRQAKERNRKHGK